MTTRWVKSTRGPERVTMGRVGKGDGKGRQQEGMEGCKGLGGWQGGWTFRLPTHLFASNFLFSVALPECLIPAVLA